MNSKRAQFKETQPHSFFLDLSDVGGFESWLKENRFLGKEENLKSLELAGAGNMNLTLRAHTTQGDFIAKQSRPWVEKFPQIPAPWGRLEIEKIFYSLLEKNLDRRIPQILHFDQDSQILLMTDFGSCGDFSDVYGGISFTNEEIRSIASILHDIHSFDLEENFKLENRWMRELNHAHMFKIPFEADNGLNLEEFTPGLESLKQKLLTDTKLLARIRELGDIYMKNGDTLLHGDFYPGSFLRHPSGVKLIDPEFAFVGQKEFDLGVFSAHLTLSGSKEENSFIEFYNLNHDADLRQKFAGVEILRRILGYAQLPLDPSLKSKEQLIEKAVAKIA